MSRQIAIVVTALPATGSQGARFKAVSNLATHTRAMRPNLEGKANALLCAQELCTELEHSHGVLWRVCTEVLDNPAKAGSWIVVAKW